MTNNPPASLKQPNNFYVDGLMWRPEYGDTEAKLMFASDKNYDPIEVEDGRLFSGPLLVDLWRRLIKPVHLEAPTPDLAEVQRLSGKALSLGCTWGGTFDMKEGWDIACHDEVRGKWLEGATAQTLEGALAEAIALIDLPWLEEARKGWPDPSPWLAEAMAAAKAGQPVPGIL